VVDEAIRCGQPLQPNRCITAGPKDADKPSLMRRPASDPVSGKDNGGSVA
jgi:hypothetical protein